MSLQALLLSRDQESIRILSTVLNKLNVGVESCAEPFIAAKRLMDQKFDCVIVDCDDQQGSGWVLQSARLAPANRNSLTIALLSGNPKPGSFKMGENFIINKPIVAKQVESTLEIACSLMNSAALVPPVSKSIESSADHVGGAFNNTAAGIPQQMFSSPGNAPAHQAPLMTAQNVGQISSQFSSADSLEDVLEPAEPDVRTAPPVAMGRSGAAAAPARAPIAHQTTSQAPTGQRNVADPRVSANLPVRKMSSLQAPDEMMTDLREFAGPAVSNIAAAQTTHYQAPTQHTFPESDRVRPQHQSTYEPGSRVPMPRWTVAALTIVLLLGTVAYGWWHLHATATASGAQIQSSQPTPASPAVVSPSNAIVADQPAPQQIASSSPALKSFAAEPHKTAEARAKLPVEPGPEPTQITTNLEPLPAAPNLAQAQPEEPLEPPTLETVAKSSGSSAVGIMKSLPAAKPTLAPAKRIAVSQGISQGMLVQRVNPAYPAVARQAHIGGDVLLQAVIGKDGSIQHLKVLRGQPLLVQSAMTAVKQWRYRPYLLNGNPVEVETQITVQFKD